MLLIIDHRGSSTAALALANRPWWAKNQSVGQRDEALCEELKELARRLGITVREETLLREVGYRVRSGLCRVRGEEVIFIDRTLPAAERLQVLLDGLAGRDFETHFLTPALRRLLERRSAAAT
jgi:hypothetical protein